MDSGRPEQTKEGRKKRQMEKDVFTAQKSFPKFLKIDAEKLILAGNDFKELTSNAKNLAENFRDNFDRYNHHFCP